VNEDEYYDDEDYGEEYGDEEGASIYKTRRKAANL
jgi:hypothetical protein